jgi:dipeptidyl aminopeptidase/acylaminoacyl peptidase
MRATSTIAICLFLNPCFALADTVKVTAGNIYWEATDHPPKRLTSLGLDREPALSSDGKLVVFVRDISSRKKDGEQEPFSELWISSLSSGDSQRLLTNQPASQPEKNLTDFNRPAFSPDGKSVYFISSAWATSDAIHALDLKSRKVRYISPGNSLLVIRSGKYVGFLIAQKHKYFPAGGSYDHYWLVTPQGREAGLVGPEEDNVQDFLRLYQ